MFRLRILAANHATRECNQDADAVDLLPLLRSPRIIKQFYYIIL